MRTYAGCMLVAVTAVVTTSILLAHDMTHDETVDAEVISCIITDEDHRCAGKTYVHECVRADLEVRYANCSALNLHDENLGRYASCPATYELHFDNRDICDTLDTFPPPHWAYSLPLAFSALILGCLLICPCLWFYIYAF